jgi:peptidoglycan/xylan/chitin deacetylase (PgdA/CDA1 family)
MTRYIAFLTLVIYSAGASPGFSQSKLTFTGTFQGSFHPFDSLVIEDINTGGRLIKHYPDTVLNLLITGIDELPSGKGCSLSQNYPNPFNGETRFNIHLPESDKTDINIFNTSGRLILKYERYLQAGDHSFAFSGRGEKIYLVSVKTSSCSSSIKMMNTSGTADSEAKLEYRGQISADPGYGKGDNGFQYYTGDKLVFTGYMSDRAGSVLTDTISDILHQSTTYTFRFEKDYPVLILMYHKITDSIPLNEYERNSDDFENDLIYLRNHYYQILSMEDLLLLRAGDLKLFSDGIIITFDDGYESNYSKVFPLLTEYEMPATFFLVTEWMDTPDFMKWSEVWLMSQYTDNDGKAPFVMGSHTSSHPYLEQSAQYFATHDEYLNFLNTELGDSKNWITDITGQNNIFLSLPYGDGADSQDIINTAIANGYSGIRTSVWNSFTIDKMNLYALPSIPILSGSLIESIGDYLDR